MKEIITGISGWLREAPQYISELCKTKFFGRSNGGLNLRNYLVDHRSDFVLRR